MEGGRTRLLRGQRSRENAERIWRSVALLGPAALKWGCIGWLGSEASEVLIAWTGSVTRADVKLNVFTDVLSEEPGGLLLPWALAFAMFLLFRRERQLKEKAIARLGEINRSYELLSDPLRSSSQLSPSGRTNPRDPP